MNRIWERLKKTNEEKIVENNNLLNTCKKNCVETCEYIKNYLIDLVERNKNLDKETRLKNYVDFFADNFSYDYKYRQKILQSHGMRVKSPQQALFDTLTEKKGICAGFSNALSLISCLDAQKTGDFFSIRVASLAVRLKNDCKTFGHAINVFKDEHGHDIIVDITCMIHCRENDLSGCKEDFFCKSLSQYEKALNSAGVEMRNVPKYRAECNFWKGDFATQLARLDDNELLFSKVLYIKDFFEEQNVEM